MVSALGEDEVVVWEQNGSEERGLGVLCLYNQGGCWCMVVYVYVHMGVGRGSGWLVRAVERVSGGQRVALTGKGGCCPPILF
jgi:hypothetical protein